MTTSSEFRLTFLTICSFSQFAVLPHNLQFFATRVCASPSKPPGARRRPSVVRRAPLARRADLDIAIPSTCVALARAEHAILRRVALSTCAGWECNTSAFGAQHLRVRRTLRGCAKHLRVLRLHYFGGWRSACASEDNCGVWPSAPARAV